MKLGERLRWLLAATGVALWLIFPWVFSESGTARHLYRCRGRTFTGSFDDCFNDYLPVLEFLFVPLFVLLIAWPVARFAFCLYAPAPDGRRLKWPLASRRGGGDDLWPIAHVMAAAGMTWSVSRLFTYPWVGEFWPFLLYWGAGAIWFALGILAAWPRREATTN